MIKIKHSLFLFFILSAILIFPQDIKLQKLIREVALCKEDTIKVKKLIRLSDYYYFYNDNYNKSIENCQAALILAKQIKYTRGEILALSNLGDRNWFRANYDIAFKYYFKAYRLSDSIQDKKLLALVLYNLGWISCVQQHNYKDNHYLYKSLKLMSELNDTLGTLNVYNALGSLFSDKYNFTRQKSDFDSSFYFFQKAILFSKKTSFVGLSAILHFNVGELHNHANMYGDSKFYFQKSIPMLAKINDSNTLVMANYKVAICNVYIGLLNNASKELNFAKKYAIKHNLKEMELEVLNESSKMLYKDLKYKEAFDVYKKYVDEKSEVEKLAYSNSMSNFESNYFLEKSEANVARLKQTTEIQELKNKKQNYFIIILVILGSVIVIVAILLFKQNKLKQITNIKLHEQNQIISQKKLEIDHSIQYAKGIQMAILPDISDLNNYFPQSFVYYKPKDVVSGDFYWFSKVEKDFYCIVADCTGHGVPGALMSIIGIDKIVQAIFEQNITSPNKILAFLNIQIKNLLKQHADTSMQKDGMDIAILKFNSDLSAVEYSAANRPLYFVREGVLIEYKADKVAIAGFTNNDHEFTNHLISLQKGDALYLTTDGYADQFGGQKGGKKIMTKNLKNMLCSIFNLNAIEQKAILEEHFLNWKGDYEQVDDVLIIGLKI